VIVLTPIWELFRKISESTMSLFVSPIGMKSSTALAGDSRVRRWRCVLGLGAADAILVPVAVDCVLLASTKAEGGRPPMVSASAAFNA